MLLIIIAYIKRKLVKNFLFFYSIIDKKLKLLRLNKERFLLTKYINNSTIQAIIKLIKLKNKNINLNYINRL